MSIRDKINPKKTSAAIGLFGYGIAAVALINMAVLIHWTLGLFVTGVVLAWVAGEVARSK